MKTVAVLFVTLGMFAQASSSDKNYNCAGLNHAGLHENTNLVKEAARPVQAKTSTQQSKSKASKAVGP